MSAPEKLWVRTFKTGYKQATLSQQPFDPSPCGYDDAEYRRADLAPALPSADYVAGLVEAAQWARNRLEIIADESWHGDGRDLKRSIAGVFADFDKALAARPDQPAADTRVVTPEMISRFLAWKLPPDFSPDGGITFKAEFNENTAHPMRHEPSGTNLLNYQQAEAMLRAIIGEPGK